MNGRWNQTHNRRLDCFSASVQFTKHKGALSASIEQEDQATGVRDEFKPMPSATHDHVLPGEILDSRAYNLRTNIFGTRHAVKKHSTNKNLVEEAPIV
jgi:hypothetical protein